MGMPDSHIEAIAHIIDYASHLAGANSDRDRAGRSVARRKAREIVDYLEKEGLLG